MDTIYQSSSVCLTETLKTLTF